MSGEGGGAIGDESTKAGLRTSVLLLSYRTLLSRRRVMNERRLSPCRMLPSKSVVRVVRAGTGSQLHKPPELLLCNYKRKLKAGPDQMRIFSISKGRLAQSPNNVRCAALTQWQHLRDCQLYICFFLSIQANNSLDIYHFKLSQSSAFPEDQNQY